MDFLTGVKGVQLYLRTRYCTLLRRPAEYKLLPGTSTTGSRALVPGCMYQMPVRVYQSKDEYIVLVVQPFSSHGSPVANKTNVIYIYIHSIEQVNPVPRHLGQLFAVTCSIVLLFYILTCPLSGH